MHRMAGREMQQDLYLSLDLDSMTRCGVVMFGVDDEGVANLLEVGLVKHGQPSPSRGILCASWGLN
jgi:hypothetical protein